MFLGTFLNTYEIRFNLRSISLTGQICKHDIVLFALIWYKWSCFWKHFHDFSSPESMAEVKFSHRKLFIVSRRYRHRLCCKRCQYLYIPKPLALSQPNLTHIKGKKIISFYKSQGATFSEREFFQLRFLFSHRFSQVF